MVEHDILFIYTHLQSFHLQNFRSTNKKKLSFKNLGNLLERVLYIVLKLVTKRSRVWDTTLTVKIVAEIGNLYYIINFSQASKQSV